jgi:hypothetical protein
MRKIFHYSKINKYQFYGVFVEVIFILLSAFILNFSISRICALAYAQSKAFRGLVRL